MLNFLLFFFSPCDLEAESGISAAQRRRGSVAGVCLRMRGMKQNEGGKEHKAWGVNVEQRFHFFFFLSDW